MTTRPDHYEIGHPNREEIAVVISTTRRAMAGYMDLRNLDGPGKTVMYVRALRNARNWDTSEGTGELALTGPGPNATLDAACDAIIVTDVMFVRPLTAAAEASWYR